MADTHWSLLEGGATQAAPHRARFESIGAYLPEARLTSAQVMAETRHHPDIDLEALTGIRERRMCADEEDSFSLAVAAARDCLRHSRHGAGDLDMLISCSISKSQAGPDRRVEPPMSLLIKRALGAEQAMSFDLSNACAGMLSGVLVLHDFVRRGAIRRGMAVSGEFISNLRHEAAAKIEDVMSDHLASLTLGDAGAACIVERAPDGAPGIGVTTFTTLATHSRLCLGGPSELGPGGAMRTRARELHQAARSSAPQIMREALAEAGLELDDIDHMIPHQTSARVIRESMKAMIEKYGRAPKNAVITCDRLGNTASTSHFVALREGLEGGLFAEGERIMLVSIASGLEVGVTIFTMDDMVARYGRNH